MNLVVQARSMGDYLDWEVRLVEKSQFKECNRWLQLTIKIASLHELSLHNEQAHNLRESLTVERDGNHIYQAESFAHAQAVRLKNRMEANRLFPNVRDL